MNSVPAEQSDPSGSNSAEDQTSGPSASDRSDDSAAAEAHLAEYSALRSEIDWLIRDATQYQTYALGLVAVLPAAFALLLDSKLAALVIPAIIVASAAFCLFGFLFFRHHQEVYVVAAYLRNEVRPRVRHLLGSTSLWGWEEYKARKNLALRRSSRLGMLANPRFVVLVRLTAFLLPAAVGLASIVAILVHKGLDWSVDKYTWFGLAVITLGTLADLVVLVILAVWLWLSDLDQVLSGDSQTQPGAGGT